MGLFHLPKFGTKHEEEQAADSESSYTFKSPFTQTNQAAQAEQPTPVRTNESQQTQQTTTTTTTTTTGKEIAWFEELNKNSGPIAGGKGANLGEMTSLGLPVPPGFAITTAAYEEFLRVNKIKDAIQQLVDNCDVENTEQLLGTSKKIKGMIVSMQYPEGLKKILVSAYESLSFSNQITDKRALQLISSGREYAIVAIRSSATTEDLPTASFAGQQASFLNVKGVFAYLEAVKNCWASLYEPRAIFYRRKNGFRTASIAVIVQRMVNAEKAGVIFTVNPGTGSDEIIIEACWGLGESLVLGEVQPDNYIVSKKLEILQKKVNRKLTMHIRDYATDHTIKISVPKNKIEQQVLTDDEILKIAEFGKKIEAHYQNPQDIEFCIERQRIYIVQTRAVTTQAKQQAAAIEGEPILKGLAASPGIASGVVRIVNEPDDISKVQKGDVLVTVMTTPDIVPTMSKSAAIITDQGGQTCFDGDTLVLTKKGFRKIKDVHETFANDEEAEVLSIDSKTLKAKWKKIINTSKRKGKLIEISISQTGISLKNTVRLTPDHKVFTFDEFDFTSRKIEDILENENMVCSVYKIPDNNHFNDDFNDIAYLAGAIFSDGYISLKRTKGNVVFRQKNVPEKLKFISQVISDFNNAFNTNLKNYGTKCQSGMIRNKEIYGEADYFSSCRRLPAQVLTSFKNNLDFWCLSTDENNVAKFLAGIIDGDGSISTDRSRLHIYSGKNFLIEPIVISCLRLGILPQVLKNRDACLNFQLVGDNVDKISKSLNRVKSLERRKKFGYRFFAAKQLFENIADKVNYKGRIKPYIQKNLLLDSEKIRKNILPIVDNQLKEKLKKIIDSDITMLRVRKTCDVGIDDVYNLTIDAKDEEDHNYLIFTKMFTPLVVSNCHAAIVSREMGIPCVVGTETATQQLHDGQSVTVDAYRGYIYEGAIEIEKSQTAEAAQELQIPTEKIETKTKVKVNLVFAKHAEEVAQVADGVGLLRIEHMITMTGVHPAKLIREGHADEYTQILVEGIQPIAAAFAGKPVWIRTLDVRTDEFRNLQGGEKEPHEDNPMLGWHGIRRSLDEVELLKAEFLAVKKLHEAGYNNIHIMLPFVISVEEFLAAKKIADDVGLPAACNMGIMVETAAAALKIEEFCKAGIKFASVGSNDLIQSVLCIDRNNSKISHLYNPYDQAVLALIKYVIDTCNRYGIDSSICGEAGSDEKMVQILVGYGISSVSANIDALAKIRKVVAETEAGAK